MDKTFYVEIKVQIGDYLNYDDGTLCTSSQPLSTKQRKAVINELKALTNYYKLEGRAHSHTRTRYNKDK